MVLVHRGDRTRLTVGAGTSVAEDVEVLIGGNHRIDWLTTFPLREVMDLPGAYENGNPWSRGDVTVGEQVVIGRGCRILSGVEIGDGAVILPYSVVTRDVAPGAVVGGQPAAVVGGGSGASAARYRSSGVTGSDPMARLAGRSRAVLVRALRAAVDRLEGGVLPPFPALAHPPEDPQPVTMGAHSFFAPIVRAEGDADVHVEVGRYATVSYDTEFLFPPRSVDPARVTASGPDPRCGPAPDGAGYPDPPGDGRPRVRRAVVGHDAWVTRGTRVVGEVVIGPGAVVGAYSVVTSHVRPYAIVAGNPAVEVGRRFDDATVDALLRIRWWDWPDEMVRERAGELCSTDVSAFVARYDRDGR